MAAPDINLMDLTAEPIEVSGDAVAAAQEFFAPPLPDDGDHLAILRLGDRGIKADRQRDSVGQKTGAIFLNAHLALKILDDTGKETMTVFDTVTSIAMQGSGISRLQSVLVMAGYADEVRAARNLADLKALLERASQESPRVGITTRWEAQVNAGTKDKPDYQNVAVGQRKFPPMLGENGEPVPGKYNAEVKDPKSGETVRAQARITKYFSPSSKA